MIRQFSFERYVAPALELELVTDSWINAGKKFFSSFQLYNHSKAAATDLEKNKTKQNKNSTIIYSLYIKTGFRADLQIPRRSKVSEILETQKLTATFGNNIGLWIKPQISSKAFAVDGPFICQSVCSTKHAVSYSKQRRRATLHEHNLKNVYVRCVVYKAPFLPVRI